MKRRTWLMTAAALVPLGLVAGCGEKPVTVYKAGKYQGKADSQPWDNERFKGDRNAWEKAIKDRSVAQNEYARVAHSK
ncbi:MAG: hypothetical protein HYU77_00535 [Betaproteobacteria bacterium]|nr:hypothetical protein [Betaproteobacteria bacterium]